ncbi:MAG: hypothetical protein KF851_18285 [Pirellulaceae bacterium]|nr:hypothetical protein [Pirellulaceae bacterium]
MKHLTRNGLSIIEVLTAIVVALVGVAGVMILIPFAVDQAQIGFDQETSYRFGANVANDFEIKGFDDPDSWVVMPARFFEPADPTPPPPPPDPPSPPPWRPRPRPPVDRPPPPPSPPPPPVTGLYNYATRCYMIDPIGVADSADNALNIHTILPPLGMFPFLVPDFTVAMTIPGNGILATDGAIFIDRATVTSSLPPGYVLNTPLALHHFSWRDTLQTSEPTPGATGTYPTELAPPQQIFDVNGDNEPVRRQSLEELTYRVLVVPEAITPHRRDRYPAHPNFIGGLDLHRELRCYFLIEKGRQRLRPMTSTVQPYDRVYQVDHPHNLSPTYNPTEPSMRNARIAFGGGTLIFREHAGGALTHSNLAAANSLSTQRAEIRRGDWVMLTNVIFDYELMRQTQQVNFYQIDDATLVQNPEVYWQATLRGPDFDFGWACRRRPIDPQNPQNQAVNPQDYRTFGEYQSIVEDRNDPDTPTVPSRTYAVHLPSVWTVFEKTYRR